MNNFSYIAVMEQKYKIVIGISGAKNSGKDTAASMIHNIF